MNATSCDITANQAYGVVSTKLFDDTGGAYEEILSQESKLPSTKQRNYESPSHPVQPNTQRAEKQI